MDNEKLIALAVAAGIQVVWTDAENHAQRVSPESLCSLLEAMGYAAQTDSQIRQSLAELHHRHNQTPALMTGEKGQTVGLESRFAPGTPYELHYEDGDYTAGRLDEQGCLPGQQRIGYHCLQLADQALTVAIAPGRCPEVRQLCHGRSHAWGLAVQLYSLRRNGDAGAGDCMALAALIDDAARFGADAISISPVHAMFPCAADRYSPYSPSNRLFYNELYAAPGCVLGEDCLQDAILRSGLYDEMRRVEHLPMIDWPAVSAVKRRLLRQLYQDFLQRITPLQRDFEQFCQQDREMLLQHCCFQVLQEQRLAVGDGFDWHCWPAEYRDPNHAQVQEFMQTEATEIGFHAFNQWLTIRCLQQAQGRAKQAGMGIGIIADLAVGTDPCGSQAWSQQQELLHNVSVGAPPDILNRSGQNWHITALHPEGLRRHGYRAFIQMLRANLAFAGGLRIDHALGMQRLWLIPPGMPASAGAYLQFPFQDLLRLICLEAHRADALIVGEDLGTVPEGFRASMAEQGILGMQVLYFEQENGHFIPPANWSQNAVATTTTHDLPSFQGWLCGRDIDWRERLGQWSSDYAASNRQWRETECASLHRCLSAEGLDQINELDGVIAFLARTPSPLMMLPMEDALGCEEQPNLPGPGTEHPNWRRRWPQTVQEMLQTPTVTARLHGLNRQRRQQDEQQHD